VAGLLFALEAASFAQTGSGDPAQMSLEGRVAHPRTYTAAELERLPSTTVEVSFATGHGPERATYTGELLWTLIDGAGLVDEPGTRTHLLHTIVARGRDGYAVALAVGELDPGFEGKPVIVAYARDGKPSEGLRLVVPNDKRGGRSVTDLVSIEVK